MTHQPLTRRDLRELARDLGLNSHELPPTIILLMENVAAEATSTLLGEIREQEAEIGRLNAAFSASTDLVNIGQILLALHDEKVDIAKVWNEAMEQLRAALAKTFPTPGGSNPGVGLSNAAHEATLEKRIAAIEAERERNLETIRSNNRLHETYIAKIRELESATCISKQGSSLLPMWMLLLWLQQWLVYYKVADNVDF